MSYSNSCFSEYLGCQIFECIGISVQKTLLGTYTVKDKEKSWSYVVTLQIRGSLHQRKIFPLQSDNFWESPTQSVVFFSRKDRAELIVQALSSHLFRRLFRITPINFFLCLTAFAQKLFQHIHIFCCNRITHLGDVPDQTVDLRQQ